MDSAERGRGSNTPNAKSQPFQKTYNIRREEGFDNLKSALFPFLYYRKLYKAIIANSL